MPNGVGGSTGFFEEIPPTVGGVVGDTFSILSNKLLHPDAQKLQYPFNIYKSLSRNFVLDILEALLKDDQRSGVQTSVIRRLYFLTKHFIEPYQTGYVQSLVQWMSFMKR